MLPLNVAAAYSEWRFVCVLTVVATLMPPVDVIAATALGMLVEL